VLEVSCVVIADFAAGNGRNRVEVVAGCGCLRQRVVCALLFTQARGP